jgi:hypothetical protein
MACRAVYTLVGLGSKQQQHYIESAIQESIKGYTAAAAMIVRWHCAVAFLVCADL